MLYLDVDALNAKFWATALTYKDAAGITQTLPASQKLVENQPDEELDETAPSVRWTITPGESKLTAISPPLFTSLGIATLQIFVPKGKGTGACIDIKEAFETAFREWRSTDKRLRIYKMSSTKCTEKNALQVNVIVFYESKRYA